MRTVLLATLAAAAVVANVLVPAEARAMEAGLRLPLHRTDAVSPVETVACVGFGWRGPGIYASILGARPACWGSVVYGEPAYVVAAPPAVVAAPSVVVAPQPTAVVGPPSTVWYYCDTPKGYYPQVAACTTGWRTVTTAP
jgi:hypothetical protein